MKLNKVTFIRFGFVVAVLLAIVALGFWQSSAPLSEQRVAESDLERIAKDRSAAINQCNFRLPKYRPSSCRVSPQSFSVMGSVCNELQVLGKAARKELPIAEFHEESQTPWCFATKEVAKDIWTLTYQYACFVGVDCSSFTVRKVIPKSSIKQDCQLGDALDQFSFRCRDERCFQMDVEDTQQRDGFSCVSELPIH